MFPKKNKFVELKGLSAFHLFKSYTLDRVQDYRFKRHIGCVS